ncbi:MAG: ABC transporter ATP-binding protein [Clostridia bacterium]|nr:ABC transporter ATP-binding protein [Clostridia bacterium]
MNERISLTVRSLTKSFGGVKVVDDLSFDVPSGSVFSLLGVNGAGKTTAIRMLTGLLTPDSGTAFLASHPMGSDAAARIIGLSPQETSTAPNLTVAENLIMTASVYGMDSPESRAAELMERLSLTDHRNKRSKHLSGGLRRRLSIAMGIIHEPEILFLDEPTLGLDVLARRKLWSLVNELRRSMTILLTTHYMEEAEALSDTIAVMDHGHLLACGTMEELRQLTGLVSLEDIFVSLAQKGGVR